MVFPRATFRATGLTFLGYPPALDDRYHQALSPLQIRVWRAHFGVCPRSSYRMWLLLLQQEENAPQVQQRSQGLNLMAFFMTLFFLKTYPTNEVMASRVQKDPKTVRKWVRWYISKMSRLSPILVSWDDKERKKYDTILHYHTYSYFISLHFLTSPCPQWNKVCWNDRLLGGGHQRIAKTTTDGTDTRICEPSPFSRSWWSHKINGPALRYELCVAVGCSRIVWVHGPFRAGRWPDTKIFKRGLRQILDHFGEKTIADAGYRGLGDWIQAKGDPLLSPNTRRFNTRARARHETVNRRIKQFDCLNQRWRHPLHKHEGTFMAIVCLTYIQMEFEPLFD